MAKKLAADIITVDMSRVDAMVKRGVDIVLDPSAEQALLDLLALKTRIDNAIDEAKQKIEARALAYNPNFKSVQADKIKVGYQFFGAQYVVDIPNVKKLPKNLYKSETKYSVITPELKKWLKEHEHNTLPLGINERERSKKITIKPIAQFEDVE